MLRLIYSPTSPYARKVRMTAMECGRRDFELITDNPMAEGSNVSASNPLGKVPALILEDGKVMIDSPVICEFIDQDGRAPTLVPPLGPSRFDVLTTQALADGIMDAAVATRLELLRPEAARSAHWLGRWEAAISRSLPILEQEVCCQDRFDLGTISAICALLYLEFRLPDQDFVAEGSALAKWLAPYRDRPSVRDTAPE